MEVNDQALYSEAEPRGSVCLLHSHIANLTGTARLKHKDHLKIVPKVGTTASSTSIDSCWAAGKPHKRPQGSDVASSTLM